MRIAGTNPDRCRTNKLTMQVPDDFCDSNRNANYALLKFVNETWPDCTSWFESFLEGGELSMHRVRERKASVSCEMDEV